MHTTIVAAFPGSGKTHWHLTDPDNTADSDSSSFSWIDTASGRTRNPEFPGNYIKHIKSLIGTKEIIFISTHAQVIEAMLAHEIEFINVLPERESKEIYMEKYRVRGSDSSFIELVSNNWDLWHDMFEAYEPDTKHTKVYIKEHLTEIRDLVSAKSNQSSFISDRFLSVL
jgi:hypothetical protein